MAQAQMPQRYRQAIVVGGSMAGLIAAHPDVLKDLCQVIHMIAAPTILFKPRYLWLALPEKPSTIV